MKPLANLIGALSFDDATSKRGNFLRKLYFVVAYNTTLPVNVMVALGSIAPYLLYLALTNQLSVGRFSVAIGITVLSAFSYSLIYVINDYIDRAKDVRLAIPKQTAQHVLGANYLLYVATAATALVALAGAIMPSLLLPLATYDAALMILSVLHSYAKRGKAITIFIERFFKFCAPYGLIYAATLDPTIRVMMLSAMLVYPLGFKIDYAYRGYLRDRLKINGNWRFALYGLYWAIVGIVTAVTGNGLDLHVAALYISSYFGLVALAAWLSRVVPYNFLNGRYNAHVAGEKRRLLTYGALQLVVVALGGIYVIFN